MVEYTSIEDYYSMLSNYSKISDQNNMRQMWVKLFKLESTEDFTDKLHESLTASIVIERESAILMGRFLRSRKRTLPCNTKK